MMGHEGQEIPGDTLVTTRFLSTGAVLVVAAALTISACGSPSTPRPASASPTPTPSPSPSSTPSPIVIAACTMVTQSQAATITGDSSIPVLVNTSDLCDYSQSGGGHIVAEVLVFEEPASGDTSLSDIKSAIASHAGSSTSYQPVSGIGSSAYGETDTNGAAIGFVAGNTLVVIGAKASSKSGSSLLSAIEPVASTIAGQLCASGCASPSS